MMVLGFQPGYRALTSMFGYHLPAAGFGEQQLNDAGSCHTANSAVQYGDKLSECSRSEQADSPSASDVSQYGIYMKAGGYQDRMSNVIEKR